jgi:hypothetical protein
VEANTEQKKWWLPCCNDPQCHQCKGTGRIYPERCPCYYYRDVKTLRYLYDAYRFKNILPFAGSPIEQPVKLIKTFDLVDQYVFFYEEDLRKRKEHNEEVASNFRKRLGGG